jgi:Phage integrase family
VNLLLAGSGETLALVPQSRHARSDQTRANTSVGLLRGNGQTVRYAKRVLPRARSRLRGSVLGDENRISIEQVFRRGEILNRTKTKASKAPVPMCEALARTLNELRQQTEYSRDEDFVFASPTLEGKRPLWGQTMNAVSSSLPAVALGLVSESEHSGWHRFRHSLSSWANETTKDITVSQTMLRHGKPDTTAIYTHGNSGKALDGQRVYMERLLRMKPRLEEPKAN